VKDDKEERGQGLTMNQYFHGPESELRMDDRIDPPRPDVQATERPPRSEQMTM